MLVNPVTKLIENQFELRCEKIELSQNPNEICKLSAKANNNS